MEVQAKEKREVLKMVEAQENKLLSEQNALNNKYSESKGPVEESNHLRLYLLCH